jgi:tryptophan-rich sensory protein
MWKKIKPYIKTFIVGIAIPIGVGLLSAFLTKDNMDIYGELIVPALAPPGWLFPVAWTILYAIMGISSAMIYLRRGSEPTAVRESLTSYGISLVINFAWSILFFNANAFLLSFVWLVLLFYFIIKTIIGYYRIDKRAAYLQIPYALWVAFAGYLNISIYFLNS